MKMRRTKLRIPAMLCAVLAAATMFPGASFAKDDAREAALRAAELVALADADTRARMGCQARLLAERGFSADAMASGLIRMYDRVVRA
jgi:hypothetical protein